MFNQMPTITNSPPPHPTLSNPHRSQQVQLGDKLALVREGKVVHVLATANSSLFPRVAAVRPLAAQADAEGCLNVSLWGHNLDNEEDTILARSNGACVICPCVKCADVFCFRGHNLDNEAGAILAPSGTALQITHWAPAPLLSG